MNPKLLSHKEILKGLGTRSILARELGCPYSTVQSWEMRDSIPRWQWHNLRALARRKGHPRITIALLAATAVQPRPKLRNKHSSKETGREIV